MISTISQKDSLHVIYCCRACRLKKKAQHEANKLKLYGLEQEHSKFNLSFILDIQESRCLKTVFLFIERMMTAIEQSRQLVFAKLDGTLTDVSEPLSAKVERISKFGTSKIIC